MYKAKKIMSVALAGATAASLIAVAANAGSDYSNFDPTGATYGLIGDFNGWAEDLALTDEDGDGLYEATVSVPETGSSYKVRANGAWDFSWGVLDEEGYTANSQTNCSFDESVFGTDVTVYFDTRTGMGGVNTWYVGTDKPADDVTPVEPSSKPEDEPSVPDAPAGKYDAAYEAAKTQLGEAELAKYYFFDNSETKWPQVGAYWWTPAEPAPWPGVPAIQIEGTDIWAVEYDPATTQIIFNNLVSDADYSVDNPKAQMPDTTVAPETNGGLIFVPDMSTQEVKEDGAVIKVSGNWSTFQGTPVEPSTPEESSKPTEPSNETPKEPTSTSDNSGKGVNTGDSSAPFAIAAVFAAAALTAVVLTKKKASSK